MENANGSIDNVVQTFRSAYLWFYLFRGAPSKIFLQIILNLV